MSTTRGTVTTDGIDSARCEKITPVEIAGESLDSLAPGDLLDFKRTLIDDGLIPAVLTVEGCFDDDCSFDTQTEADRIREYVRAASFLGAGTLVVTGESVVDEAHTRQALAACAERANREGVAFEFDGPIELH